MVGEVAGSWVGRDLFEDLLWGCCGWDIFSTARRSGGQAIEVESESVSWASDTQSFPSWWWNSIPALYPLKDIWVCPGSLHVFSGPGEELLVCQICCWWVLDSASAVICHQFCEKNFYLLRNGERNQLRLVGHLHTITPWHLLGNKIVYTLMGGDPGHCWKIMSIDWLGIPWCFHKGAEDELIVQQE